MLTRYRVMAYLTAVLLIVLVFVGIPLQVEGHPGVVNILGTLHGFLYLVYLVVAFELTRKLHIPMVRTFLVLLAGTVPFGAIVAERKLTAEYSKQAGAVRQVPGPDVGTETSGTAPQEA